MLMRTETGRKRWKGAIQSTTQTRSNTGDVTDAWATITDGTQWGELRQLRGRESEFADQVVPIATHTWRCRWLTGVTTEMQLVVNSVTYSIERVDDRDFSQLELILYVKVKL